MEKEQKIRVQRSFEAEQGGLSAYIRSRTNSLQESEDLLQEVFLQALSSLNVLDAVDNITGWLYTIARNKVIDWYRKRKLPAVSLDSQHENGAAFSDLLADEIPEGLDEESREFVFRSITDAVDQLPADQKYVFIEQVIEGRTFRDLAAETGVSINTLIARKRYAVQFLRQRLKSINKLL